MRALFCYAGIRNRPSRVLSPKEFDIRFRHAAHFLKKSLLTRLFCGVKCRRITRGKSGYPIQNSRFLDSAHRDLSPGMFTSALRFVARADRALSPACLRPLYIFDLESITTRPTPDVLCGQIAFSQPGIEPNLPPSGAVSDLVLFSNPESAQTALIKKTSCFQQVPFNKHFP